MLSYHIRTDQACIKPDDRYTRNVKEDMKVAMDLMFQFKDGLDKLHPDCAYIIERLLQNPNSNRF